MKELLELANEPHSLDVNRYPCVLHGHHSPVVWYTLRHHVIPQAWTQNLGLPESRVIPVCGTGHDGIHSAIRSILKGERPLRQVDEKVRPYVDEAVSFWKVHYG